MPRSVMRSPSRDGHAGRPRPARSLRQDGRSRGPRGRLGWQDRHIRHLLRSGMWMAWPPACLMSSSRTAGGTARWRTVPFARRSRPRSMSWKECWRTSAQPVALWNPSRLDAGVRSTSSNESCSEVRAAGRSSTQPGCNSRFRPDGTTTRALEYLRSVGDVPDSRTDKAIELLRSKQQPDGTWLLENTHPGKVHFALEGGGGRPSRWNTHRALRVLSWYEQSAT
jgi:hypothetical protein